MSCFHPLEAYTAGGEVWIGRDPTRDGRFLELPCGCCIGCKTDKTLEWSVRLMHEAQLHESNWFATMTYSPAALPESLSLEYSDFQGFMKRLRKQQRRRVRFFVAGEYGEETGRPHWHAILFGCAFTDAVRLHNGCFQSPTAERLWKVRRQGRLISAGSVLLGTVTPQSAAYVAGYTVKKVYGQRAKEFYEDVVNVGTGEVSSRRPEMCAMSRRPGIGATWYERFGSDLFPHDFAVTKDGKKAKVPRFYLRRFEASADPNLVEDVKERRISRAMENLGESSPERRAVREEVALARVKFFKERKL